MTRISGIRMTAHLVLRPIRRFASAGAKGETSPASRTGGGLTSLIGGRGDGGGVNMTGKPQKG